VPEHRLCARVDLRWHDGIAMQAQRVYCKAGREPDGATIHALLLQLQGSAAWRGGRLRTPRALLWHAPTGTAWQEGMPGQPLLDASPALQAACAPAVGAQLAALHATPTVTHREVTPEWMRERLAEVVRVLSPVLGGSVLGAAARRWRRAGPPSRTGRRRAHCTGTSTAATSWSRIGPPARGSR
jgi:hypothetical protein